MSEVIGTAEEPEMASVTDQNTQNEEKPQEPASDENTKILATEGDTQSIRENQVGESQNKTIESDAKETPRPSPRSSRPSSGTQRPASGTQRPSSGTQRPSSGTQRPSSGTQRPSSGTQRPGSGTQPPSSGTQPPSSGTQPPSSGTQRPSSGTQQPSPRPSSGTQRPSSGTQRPSSGTQRPPSGTQRPPSATERPNSATERPSSATKQSTPSGEEAHNETEEPKLETKSIDEESAMQIKSIDEKTIPEEDKEADNNQLVQKSSQEQTQSALPDINEEKTSEEEKESESKPNKEPTDKVVTSQTNKTEEEPAASSPTDQSVAASSSALNSTTETNQVLTSRTNEAEEEEAPLGRMAQGIDSSFSGPATNAEAAAAAEGTEGRKKLKRPVKLTVAEAQQRTRNLMEELNSFESYDNTDTVTALKALGRLYFDHKSKRKAICEVLLETDYAALVMKLLVTFNKIGIFKSDDVWFPAYYILNTTWNYTDASKELAKALADKGIIQLMLANITHQPYLENIGSKLSPSKNPLVSTPKKPLRKPGPGPAKSLNNVNYVVKSSLSILQNVSKVPETKPIFVEHKALEALKPFTTSDNDFFKAISMMLITAITSEADNAVLEDTGAIPFMVHGIAQALKAKNHRYRGFSPTELAECLGRMAVNDSNKMKIESEGSLPLLTEMLKTNDIDEQAAAAQCLWTLSFDKGVRAKIIEEPGCIEQLEVLTSSEEKTVHQSAKGAMWKLRGEEQHQQNSVKGAKEGGTKNHIMISYNWDHQDLILKIAERLKADGYSVWLDVEQMGGSTLGAMADAVEKAAVVVVCMSEKYKNSPNCRTEGEYTFQLRKPIVPLLVQRKYRADGWLGMLVGAKLYTDFSKHAFDKAYSMLIKELKGAGLRPTATNDEVQRTDTPVMQRAPPSASTPRVSSSVKVAAWSAPQVSQWLTDHDLQSCKDFFAEVDGKLLAALLTLRSEAPEYFYQTLEKKFNLDLINILRLINAMSELP